MIENFNMDHAVDAQYPGDKQGGETFYSAELGDDDLIFTGGSCIPDALLIIIHTSQGLSKVHFGTTIQAIYSTDNGHICATGGIVVYLKMAKIM